MASVHGAGPRGGVCIEKPQQGLLKSMGVGIGDKGKVNSRMDSQVSALNSGCVQVPSVKGWVAEGKEGKGYTESLPWPGGRAFKLPKYTLLPFFMKPLRTSAFVEVRSLRS